MENKKEYTIFFQPRSGSTLLCELLKKMKVCGLPGETFSDYWLDQIRSQYNLSPEGNLNDYISTIKKLFRSSNGVFGHKMSLYHYEKYFINRDVSDYFFTENVFYITRLDKIYQSVSDYIASETNMWAKMKDLSNNLESIENVAYNRDKLKSKFSYHINNEIKMHNFINSNKIKIQKIITYEDLCSKPNEVVKDIVSILNIRECIDPSLSIEDVRIQKQRTEINDQLVDKFINDETKFIEKKYLQLKNIVNHDICNLPFLD